MPRTRELARPGEPNSSISGSKLTMSTRKRGPDDPLAVGWRRLRRAVAFFLACLGLFVALVWIGLYH